MLKYTVPYNMNTLCTYLWYIPNRRIYFLLLDPDQNLFARTRIRTFLVKFRYTPDLILFVFTKILPSKLGTIWIRFGISGIRMRYDIRIGSNPPLIQEEYGSRQC